MNPVRAQWLWRFPGGPWVAASLTVIGGCTAVLIAGLGVRGVALHAVGWPLLVALLVLVGALTPWAFPSPYQRRAPATVGLFAYFFGLFPLLGALLFGPEPGLGEAVFSGGFFALWMTAFFALCVSLARRRGWLTPARPTDENTDAISRTGGTRNHDGTVS